MRAITLTIAGSDSGGGAGIQADLKTFAAFGVYGASVITALTAQNTVGVRAIAEVEPAFVAQQLEAVLDDLEVGAAKTGMLARGEVIEVVVTGLRAKPVPHLVVDPVITATSGATLLKPDAIAILRNRLIPLASLVTPNLREAEVLSGLPVTNHAEMREAARSIAKLGARAVLVKGGHLAGDAVDILYDGRDFHEFRSPRVALHATHGTGCTLSAAIAACLARKMKLEDAVASSKRYLTRALAGALPIGHGASPLNHAVLPDLNAED